MATIITKNGSGSAVPASLTQGELAINVDSGTLYYGSGSANAVRTITASLALSASYLIGGGAGTPGGANTTIQFNDSNTFSGSGNFTFTKATNTVKLSGSLQVTGSINVSSSIYFSTATDAGVVTTGQVGWNTGDQTLDIGLSGSAGNIPVLQIGQQQVARVHNSQGAPLTKGQVVYISGSTGNRVSVKLASATNDANSAGTLGFVLDNIPTGGEGYITTEGPLYKLNTIGYNEGELIYLSSSAGEYTHTKPVAPLHEVRLGFIERVHATVGSIYVKIDNGYELGELHDVLDTTTTSSYGDLLVKSGSVWHNSKQLTGSYAITGSLEATSFTGSLQGTASYAITASYAMNGGGGGATILKKENITFVSSSWVSQSLYVYTYTDTDIAASSSIVDFTPNTASFSTVVNAIVYPTVVVTAGSASFFAINQPANDITGELVITNI